MHRSGGGSRCHKSKSTPATRLRWSFVSGRQQSLPSGEQLHDIKSIDKAIDDFVRTKGLSRVLANLAAVQILCPPDCVQVGFEESPVRVGFHAGQARWKSIDNNAGFAGFHE